MSFLRKITKSISKMLSKNKRYKRIIDRLTYQIIVELYFLLEYRSVSSVDDVCLSADIVLFADRSFFLIGESIFTFQFLIFDNRFIVLLFIYKT